MRKKRRDSLSRKKPTLRYRSVCWVSTEGETERDYLRMNVFRNDETSVRFPTKIHPQRVHPSAVLKRLLKSMRGAPLRKNDEAWVVVDRDEWSEGDIEELIRWSKEDVRHHLAISNPKFELFLVMHFDKASGCTTPARVDAALARKLPGYRKHVSSDQFNAADVRRAIENARAKRRGSKEVIPQPGMTDVYKLAERLLGSSG